MGRIVMHEPITLGDKLAPDEPKVPHFNFAAWLRHIVYASLNFALLAAIAVVVLWWLLTRPDVDRNLLIVLLLMLAASWLFVYRLYDASRPRKKALHPLLANDRQGFMRDLRLDAKTVIVDGSNVYHFGRNNGLDAQPLGEIVHELRAKGYRIVCFFDANIFYTLCKHGAFPSDQRHSLQMLEDIFGLKRDEIYVVPSGILGDKYVLDSLKYLPISFAVTNDQFRDHAKEYATVMNDKLWRKSVVISKNGVKLH